MRSKLRGQWRNLALYFLVWTVVGIFFFSQGLVQKMMSREPTPWWHYLFSWLTGVYVSASLTPVILWCGKRFPITRANWIRRSALHLTFAMMFSIGEMFLHSVLLRAFGLFPTVMTSYAATVIILATIGFHQNILTYWVILALQYGWSYYRRFQEREKQALRLELVASEFKERLTRAQLGALKMQLQPHFLYNTLNAIMVLVRQQRGHEAEETLGLLGDLLRCVLDDVEAQEVPLRRELHYLELYLAIEQIRFRDRLHIEISAEASILDAAVPHMGLQPIVENAIRHGIGRSSSAGQIRVSASRVGERLCIAVQDDGPGLDTPNAIEGRGIGLSNTRARLQQLYGDAASLTVENAQPRGAVATMTVPYHTAGTFSEEVMEVHAVHDLDS